MQHLTVQEVQGWGHSLQQATQVEAPIAAHHQQLDEAVKHSPSVLQVVTALFIITSDVSVMHSCLYTSLTMGLGVK